MPHESDPVVASSSPVSLQKVFAVSDQQITPGFYDDGSGTQRYWDGRAWTQHTRPAVPPVSPPPASPAPPIEPTRSSVPVAPQVSIVPPATERKRTFVETVDRLRPRMRNALIAGSVEIALIVGIGVGAAGRSSDEAEAAATSSAATVAASMPTATPVAAETSEASVDSPAQTEEPSKEPDATSHGVTEEDAMLACVRYGDEKFPYGFKDHAILGNIAQYMERNHWFIKHEVTITNAYGTNLDTEFECTVGGTDANPKVTEFYVYA